MGGNSTDYIYGEDGNDTITGSGGNDIITGGLGFDFADGGAGNDSFYFVENDTFTGGSGADTFIFFDGAEQRNNTITDFSQSEGDKVQIYDIQGQLEYSITTQGNNTTVEFTREGSTNDFTITDFNGVLDIFNVGNDWFIA